MDVVSRKAVEAVHARVSSASDIYGGMLEVARASITVAEVYRWLVEEECAQAEAWEDLTELAGPPRTEEIPS